MTSLDPIASRLERLHDQWLLFTKASSARLLLWLADENERAMIDAFVAREADEEAARTPDLFVQLESPFTSDEAHGYSLASELAEQYRALAGSGEVSRAPWSVPHGQAQLGDVRLLLQVLSSFRAHHSKSGSPTRLAVLLAAPQVRSPEGYQRWLSRLVEQAPETLRFVIVDAAEAPSFGAIGALSEGRVVVRRCELGMGSALSELAASVGEETQGAAFRRLQTAIGQRLECGDLAGAAALVAEAETLATSQGWLQLAAVAHLMLASGYAAAQRPHEALVAYAAVERLGARQEAQDGAQEASPCHLGGEADPGGAIGRQLRLQAQLGQGALLLMNRAFAPAATVYEAAAERAHSLGAPGLAIDAYRLASLARSELGEADAAWELATRGLAVGMTLDDAARRNSTLPYLADQLLRLSERHGRYGSLRDALEQRLAQALGHNWRETWRDALLASGTQAG